MMHSFRKVQTLITSCVAVLSSIRCGVVSVMVGTVPFKGLIPTTFTLSGALTPLIGISGSLSQLGIFFGVRTLFSLFFLSWSSVPFLAYHLPTLFASLTLRALVHEMPLRTRSLYAALCFACIALFNLHPVGAAAGLYSLYWCIPAFLIMYNPRSFFFKALASTFVAHGVGSVLWLVTHPAMTAATWLALIPVVLVERTIFAAVLTLGYTLSNSLYKRLTNISTQTVPQASLR